MCLHQLTRHPVVDLEHVVLLQKDIADNHDLNSRRLHQDILWNVSSGIIRIIKGGSLLRNGMDQCY